ncbi:MAG: isoprenylcysteine carboxylmethyltransferase family protein [Granulosicoccus sp.]
MASPFAAYLYSVYGPGLDSLQNFGLSGWMIWFFLPHLVAETRSSFVDYAEAIGITLFVGGLISFSVGAFQVYCAKIRKIGMVGGGIYQYIRHPQYAALMIASLGLLLIWPRFLVLFSTVTMIFAYVALARAEEQICAVKFSGYSAYQARTGMFLPPFIPKIPLPNVQGRVKQLIAWTFAFLFVILVATLAAFGVRNYAIESLYTYKVDEGIYLSVTKLSDNDMARIAQISRTQPDVVDVLATLSSNDRFIAYVVPTQMYISEIPMQLPAEKKFTHSVPKARDSNRYKVIFSRADFPNSGLPVGGDILKHAVHKHALIEVHIQLGSLTVERVLPPPDLNYYPDVQVPLF